MTCRPTRWNRRRVTLALALLGATLAAAPARSAATAAAPREVAGPRLEPAPGLDPEARPTALDSVDLDGDRLEELLAGYAVGEAGQLAIYRGLPRPRPAPGRLDETGPFDPAPRLLSLPVAPDRLLTGDFDDDGAVDLIVARRGDSALYLLRGGGDGSFDAPIRRELPGTLLDATSGEVNRRDGRLDFVLAVAGSVGTELLVFEGRAGAWNAEPERIAAPPGVRSLRIGQLDDHFARDIAAIAGGELLFVAGRDRWLAASAERRAAVAAPELRFVQLPYPVAALATADFEPQVRYQEELLLLATDGGLQLARFDDASRGGSLLPLAELGAVAPPAVGTTLVAAPVGPHGELGALLREPSGGGLVAIELAPSGAALRTRPVAAGLTNGLALATRLRGRAVSSLVLLAGDAPTLLPETPAGDGVNSPLDLPDGCVIDGICDTGCATTALTGICTLRAAIQTHNMFGTGIGFEGSFLDANRIQVTSLLPDIVLPVGIDGANQVEIDGSGCIGGCNRGLEISAGPSSVTDLAIYGFTGFQLTFENAAASSASGNHLGTHLDYTSSGGNGLKFLNSPSGTATDNFVSGLILFEGAGTNGGTATGNHVGVGPGGEDLAFGSIDFQGGGDNTVLNNFVAGSGYHVRFGTNANAGLIASNVLGTDPTGSVAMGGLEGIEVSSPDNNIFMNLVSGNAGNGISLVSPTAARNVVEQNRVGTDAGGSAAIPNTFDGVRLSGSGGENVVTGNLISGNGGQGVDSNFSGAGNEIRENKIGTDLAGATDLGNVADGIACTTPSVTIETNLVSGNGGAGILADGSAGGHTIRDNVVGTDVSGSTAIANLNGGIVVRAPNTLVEGNLSSGNGDPGNPTNFNGHGIIVATANATNVTILDNRVGVAAGGGPLGNVRAGVYFNISTHDNVLGPGNEIAYNGLQGVVVGSGTGNRITESSIHDNGGLGIDLGDDGPTANDPGDGDLGPNRRQNHPVLTTATFGNQTVIDGTLSSQPSKDYRVELFSNDACDPSGRGEGRTFLGAIQVTTDGSGDATFSVPLDAIGSYPAATATDLATGDTSEHSPCLDAAPRTAVINSVGDASDQAPADGDCDTGATILRDGVPEPECTLRAFIQHANALAGPDVGRFDVPSDQYPPTGEPTLQPAAPFPAIQGPVILDGGTQPGPERVAVDFGLTGGALQAPTGGPCPAVALGSAGFDFGADLSVLRGIALFCYDTGIRSTGSKNAFTDLVIGTDFASTPGIGGGIGVELLAGTMTEIARNVVVSNSFAGVYLGPTSGDASVHYNLVGTDAARQPGLGNATGLLIDNSPDNVLNANTVLASVAEGIRVSGAASTQTLIQNNLVGTDGAWIQGLGNGLGIQLVDTFGGQIRYNLVASNVSHGIVLNGVENTDVVGNHVGTNPAGDDLGNGGDGVLLAGTAVRFAMNVLSGNGGNGLHIIATSADNIVIDNRIGVTPDGVAALGNGENGVLLQGAHGTFVGGPGIDAEPTGNLISGNTLAGVRIEGGEDNQVLANGIGTGPFGFASIPNAEGVSIQGALRTWVGLFAGDEAPAPNLIAGNDHDGIVVGDGTMETRIENNWIGIHPVGAPVPNLDAGIRFVGASSARNQARFNTIGYNGDAGVEVGAGHASAELRGNRIGRNGDLGIDLEGDGVTFNDPGDGDSGANGRQNFPVVTDILVGAMGNATIRGTLDSAQTGSAFRIEAFANDECDPSDFGEGEVPIALGIATPGPAGYSFVLVGALDPGELVTTTATQLYEDQDGTQHGATSEFSECVSVPLPDPIILINEVDAVAGTDLEFVEVSSDGLGGQTLADLVLVFYDGASDLVTAAFDLDGFVTDAEGYFVAGGANVVDVDLVLPDGTLENGADAVALYEGSAVEFPAGAPLVTANLFDALVYGPQPDDLELLALLEPGQPQPDEAGAGDAPAHSLQRCPDSAGGMRFSDLYTPGPPTPGAENDCVVCQLSPPLATVPPGGFHEVVATLLDRRILPLVGSDVDFEILTGPNAGVLSTETSDSHGEATFVYQGAGGEGLDQIRASGTSAGRPFRCEASVTWFDAALIFTDGFESGDTTMWTLVGP